ncbi:toxin co-regulated pilus biosynthesis outer membrane protein C [Vibrio cholerae]|nr:toxin co-regulated pilus biosynthesis outer membrane protein C [Vibrio cholerae]
MPKILDDGRIQISSGFSRKQLVSIGTAQGITLPTVDENESMNTVTMNPGEVRLAMLFKDNYIQNSNGVQLLGGGTENKKSARYIAVLVGASSYKTNDLASNRVNIYD